MCVCVCHHPHSGKINLDTSATSKSNTEYIWHREVGPHITTNLQCHISIHSHSTFCCCYGYANKGRTQYPTAYTKKTQHIHILQRVILPLGLNSNRVGGLGVTCNVTEWDNNIILAVGRSYNYVIVIAWVRGMYGIYCTEAQGHEAPEGWGQ